MRKYLILFPILSIIIILPPLYTHWSDIRNAKRIRDTITQARQIDGISLSSILKDKSRNKLIILYTGNTQSRLEPHGHYRGSSGGIARKATVIKRIREGGFATLVLDAGGMFSGETSLDQMRSDTCLKAMCMMGYDAVCISADEFRFGREYLKGQIETCGVPFLSANLYEQGRQFAQPYIIRDLGRFKVAITGVSNITTGGEGIFGKEPVLSLVEHIGRLSKEANLVVLLSSLSVTETRDIAKKLEGIDIIISCKHGEPEKVRNTKIYYSAEKSEMGILSISPDGTIYSSHNIIMQDDIQSDMEVVKLVSGFYRRVASIPNVCEPLPVSEAQDKNAYIGSSGCAACHTREYEQWSMTRHAASFHALKKMERDRYPNCMLCHTTGFGYETGYSLTKPKEELRSVGCETCHGPGERHSYEPTKENIRGKVSKEICAQCHTHEYSPGLMDVIELVMPRVDHRQKAASIRDILDERISLSYAKPTVDLFVMSYCPFGVMAENTLIPLIDEFGSKINFNLYFIAEEEKKPAKDVWSRFKSMHGEDEVMEDMRQVVIGKYHSDKLFDYILERNKSLRGNWEDTARKVGVDPAKVQKILESEEGAILFRDNIRRCHELGIRASPTLMINSVKLPNSVIYSKGVKGKL